MYPGRILRPPYALTDEQGLRGFAMHSIEQAIGLILFGFIVGLCVMGSCGLSILWSAQARRDRARKQWEAREAALRG